MFLIERKLSELGGFISSCMSFIRAQMHIFSSFSLFYEFLSYEYFNCWINSVKKKKVEERLFYCVYVIPCQIDLAFFFLHLVLPSFLGAV